MAYRRVKAFGTTHEFWVNLQRDYDLLSFDENSKKRITYASNQTWR